MSDIRLSIPDNKLLMFDLGLNKCIAARCCRVANDLINFTGDRKTNESNRQTDKQTEGHRRPVKPRPRHMQAILNKIGIGIHKPSSFRSNTPLFCSIRSDTLFVNTNKQQ